MTTPNLQLPELAASQSQPHVTVNSALRRLDGIVQLTVTSMSQNAPPGSPADGVRYVVGSSPTGAWAGHARDVAIYVGTAWVFLDPADGWLAFNQADGLFYWYDAGSLAWTLLATGGGGSGSPVSGSAIDYQTDADWFDELIGSLGSAAGHEWLTTSGGSGAAVANVAIAGHPGVIELSTGTTSSGQAQIYRSNAVASAAPLVKLSGDAVTMAWLFKLDNVPSAGENFDLYVGLSESTAAQNYITARVYLTGGNVRWRVQCSAAGSAGGTDGSTGPAASTWYLAELVCTSSVVSLYVTTGGTRSLIATHSANIPTAGITPTAQIYKLAGTTNRTAHLDFCRIRQTISGGRY